MQLRSALLFLCAAMVVPKDGSPATESTIELAAALEILEAVRPAELEAQLASETRGAENAFASLVVALDSARSPHLREAIAGYLGDVARAGTERVAAGACETTPDSETDAIVRRLVVDPGRFKVDGDFRSALEPVVRHALSPTLPRWVRSRALRELDRELAPDFEWLERVALEWGLASRASRDRELASTELGSLSTQGVGAIRLSVYSLPERFVAPTEAVRFLSAVRAVDPERHLVVVADGETLRALRAWREELRLLLIDGLGRGYSPWPRDALTFLRSVQGQSVILLRPNEQTGRERDSELARLLVQSLPDDVDQSLGGLLWARSTVPYHNGQILDTERTTWISIHALERRALEILGLDRVPAQGFGDTAVLDRYLGAVRDAAAELEDLLNRPVSFVHPLPAVGSRVERQQAAWLLGGSAGHDLDSLLTLLPREGQLPVALVASLEQGARLLASTGDPALAEVAALYGLDRDRLREGLERALSAAAIQGLGSFLESSARHLAELGLEVSRLPLLVVPGEVRQDGSEVDFLLTWNNVVLQRSAAGSRAEGFSSGLLAADEAARAVFTDAGYRLDLFPVVTGSVLANGGYRCASNHDRVPPAR